MIKVVVGNNVKRESVIVAPETTLRKVLEDAQVDYTRGAMHLDGTSLHPGDLDKSFADFGVAEKCFLLNVVKADNAVSATICGDAVVVTSNLKFDDIALVQRFCPKALTIVDKETKELVFSMMTGASPSITKYGVVFSGKSRDNSGRATLTLFLSDSENAKEFVADKYGVALTYIDRLEGTLPEVIESIKSDRDAVMEAITVQ